jgi:biopolymer transport protein ExbB
MICSSAAPLAFQLPKLLLSGGGTMIPLLLASVVLVAVVLERLIMLRRRRVLPDVLVRLLEQPESPEAARALRGEVVKHDAPLARILQTGVRHAARSKQEATEAMTLAGREEARSLERGLVALDTLAVACPLLGLLGTVLGMLDIFSGIAQEGAYTPQVSAGIAKALITTVVGLIIAIPSLVAHNYFMRRVDNLVFSLEKYATVFVSGLYPSDTERKGEITTQWNSTERGGASP